MKPSISIISPIYNDISTVPEFLPKLEKMVSNQFDRWEIVLVDDGSVDGSRAWVERYIRNKKYFRLRLHRKNLGIAKTYRELYGQAKNDIIVLFSLDGGWDPRDAVKLAQTVIDSGADIVVGVRKKKIYTPWRMVVSFFYNTLTQVIFGVTTMDAGSIKAFRREVVRKVPIISNGVFDEAERLIRAKRMGYSVSYIPIHHAYAKKVKLGIRFTHIVEACRDATRLFSDIHMRSSKKVAD